ncbi:MAG: triple tyrosine motif-containing protein [Bacteroidota bacterium]|nr:triple tyrosine motif-containing protein [Bacteroidota bacterium]
MKKLGYKYWILIVIAWLCGFAGLADELVIKQTGDPFIKHFSKRDYHGGTQNWAFVQGSNHILYAGNNQGILRFDGSSWNLIPLPNQSVVRSLFQDHDGTIYAGGFNEFGFLRTDDSGKLIYESLLNNVEGNEFGEVWTMARSGDYLYFQTYDALIIWDTRKDEWTYTEARIQFGFMHELGDQLLMNDFGRGIVEIEGANLSLYPGGEFFAQREVWRIISLRDNVLICTQNDGVFELSEGQLTPWETEINNVLVENRLYSVVVAQDYVYWGSILNGLYISDRNGKVIQNLNKERGLSNNTVLSIFLDIESNLWLGLDNGIDQVHIHSPASSLFSGADIGSGYAAAYFEGRIYLGTNQGLYSIPDYRYLSASTQDSQVESVDELAGQVWSLHVAGDHLLVGHNFGTFAVKGGLVEQIGSMRGGWNFESVPNHPELILQGTYDGLQLFEITANRPRLRHQISGFNESGKMLLFENKHTVWIGHGYQGIYRLVLNSDFSGVDEIKLFDDKSGLGSRNFNELLSVSPDVLVCNRDGFFVYDKDSGDFVRDDIWNANFNEQGRMTRLIKESEETSWYFQDGQAGKLRIFNDTLFVRDTRILTSLEESFNPSFENILFLSDRDLIFGTNDGFVHLDPQQGLPDIPEYPVLFSALTSLRSDSAFRMYLQYFDELGVESEVHPLAKIPYRDNDLRVSFVALYLRASERIDYQYLLEGQSFDWSQWSDHGYAEFTNLREGKYLLKVRARNAYGVLSSEQHLYFKIETPWHRTLVAYLSYFLIVVVFVSISWYSINKRLEREKRRALILEKRKMLHKQLQLKRDSALAEKEIVKLRNDKLRADIRHKSKQLANQTMDVLQKNRFLTDIKLEMVDLKRKAQSDEVKSSMRKMIRKIDRNIEDEDTHKVFEISFDQVHENFLRRLLESYPELTAKDLRLCAYLRLNLSSKEIAPLLNISIRGVEISRYRLRKKLNLDHKEHLAEFILGF